MKKIISLLLLLVVFSSCNEYQKALVGAPAVAVPSAADQAMAAPVSQVGMGPSPRRAELMNQIEAKAPTADEKRFAELMRKADVANAYNRPDDADKYLKQAYTIKPQEEFSTTPNWTPITAIVFTTNTLPIVSNQVSSPVVYNNGVVQGNNGNNSLFNQILTDFVSNDGNYKPNLVYEPSAQYRYIELISNRPLNTIDLSVYWKDRYGNLIPFRLASGGSATIKILFTKKNTLGTGQNPK